MREAARIEDPLLGETLDLGSAPKVAGFTPINDHRHSDIAPTVSKHDNAAIKTTAVDKPRAPKRRKIQPSAATTVSKPKKETNSKKTKKAKTSAQIYCQDISQGLSRTKPTSSGHRAQCAKTRLSHDDTLSEQNSDPQRTSDTSVEYEVKPAASGLTDKYQAAYPNVQDNVFNHATPPTPSRSDGVEAELYHIDHSCGPDSTTERQASPDVNVERPVQPNLGPGGGITIRDFGAPPFTQISPSTLREPSPPVTMMADKFEPLDSISEDPFEYGDGAGEDEFPVNKEYLEEMMQPMAVGAEEEPLSSDWRPQEFSDHTLYDDEQPRNVQSHWTGAIPDSGGQEIYDESPSSVVSEIMDVFLSPSKNSQASCILTHVSGNIIPEHARTSEGSENCFDDEDLDDGLIDLTVDEPKSLQVVFPITPAKRPSSPKLQWLPPKSYTPAKSSQIPPSFTNNSHLTPMNSNSDTLPFIRPSFPIAVRDRSPILGFTNRTVLRTCFRIGEALNAAAVASRTNVDAIIELYARVVTSSREASGGYKQFFQFGDLFTDKPPYLSGIYTFWKGVELWDVDSKGLVGEKGRGKMVRVLGRIKKREVVQGQGVGVEMVVLSVWEVEWEDVGVAKGIVCPEQSCGYMAAGIKC